MTGTGPSDYTEQVAAQLRAVLPGVPVYTGSRAEPSDDDLREAEGLWHDISIGQADAYTLACALRNARAAALREVADDEAEQTYVVTLNNDEAHRVVPVWVLYSEATRLAPPPLADWERALVAEDGPSQGEAPDVLAAPTAEQDAGGSSLTGGET